MSDPKTEPLTHPHEGGSYIRKPDGSIEQVEKPTAVLHPTGGPRDADGKPADLPEGHPELDAGAPADATLAPPARRRGTAKE